MIDNNYVKIEPPNGKSFIEYLKEFPPKEKVTLKDRLINSEREIEGKIIGKVKIKLCGEKDYIAGTLFHTRNNNPNFYKLLDDDLEIKDAILASEIEELYLKK